MKKLSILFMVAILMAVFAGECFAKDVVSTGLVDESEESYPGKCKVSKLQVITDGSNNATITLYDGALVTGKKIARYVLTGSSNQASVDWTFPVTCEDGLSVSVEGTGAGAIVDFEPVD